MTRWSGVAGEEGWTTHQQVSKTCWCQRGGRKGGHRPWFVVFTRRSSSSQAWQLKSNKKLVRLYNLLE